MATDERVDATAAARPHAGQLPSPAATTLTGPVRRRGPAWVTEVLLVALLYVSYELVGAMAPARVSTAFANARTIMSIERFLHLDPELALNRALTSSPTLSVLASFYYQFAHETVALVILVILWRRHRPMYALLRNTLVAVSLAAVAVFWLLPVAPPRMALLGAVDTVSGRPGLVDSSMVTGLANLYAAMPSLHVAWAVWCALAISVATTWRWRMLAWCYPVATSIVVLATANHYVLDVVAGAVLVPLAWRLVTRAPTRVLDLRQS